MNAKKIVAKGLMLGWKVESIAKAAGLSPASTRQAIYWLSKEYGCSGKTELTAALFRKIVSETEIENFIEERV